MTLLNCSHHTKKEAKNANVYKLDIYYNIMEAQQSAIKSHFMCAIFSIFLVLKSWTLYMLTAPSIIDAIARNVKKLMLR